MNFYNIYFDKIFYINLDYRIDRKAHIENQFAEAQITNYERISAVKPEIDKLPKHYYNNLQSPRKNIISYIIGSMGCKLSHYKAIKLAKEHKYKSVLIFEDDIVFNKFGEETFKKHESILEELRPQLSENDWDILYFAGNNLVEPEQLTKNLFRPVKTLSTYAYAIKDTLYDTMLDNMFSDGCEIDNYYINYIQKKYKCLYIRPTLINHAVSYSDVVHRVANYKINT